MFNNKKGQSIVEYAILLGVVIAALLIMQVFIKRGVQGGLKDSADKLGDQFSAGGTTIYQKRGLEGNQIIHEEVGTVIGKKPGAIDNFLPTDLTAKGTVKDDVYSYSDRQGGTQVAETKVSTDSASQEKTRYSDYQKDTATNFTTEKIDF